MIFPGPGRQKGNAPRDNPREEAVERAPKPKKKAPRRPVPAPAPMGARPMPMGGMGVFPR